MASPDYSDGCMIALYPPRALADGLSVDGGRGADENATVQLASPQGAWRPVVARRIALHATADALVLAAWQADTKGLSLRPATAAFRHAVGEVTASQQQRRQAATAAVLATLKASRWKRTLAALALAAQRAHTAGWQAGHHLATTSRDSDTDYDDTPTSGYTLGSPDMSDTTADATAAAALAAALAAAARRAGRAMADSAEDPQGDAEDSIDDGEDLLLATDTAVSSAYGFGTLAAYLASGVQAVSWVTAGDGLVCATCSDNEDNSPYSPFAAPSLPAHPRCRCDLAPA